MCMVDDGSSATIHNRRMRQTRILLVNNPLSYREAIASVLSELRPNLEVFSAGPDDLNGSLKTITPDIIICSELTPAIMSGARDWIELYPRGESTVVVSVAGERSTFDDIELPELLSVIDSTAEVLQRPS
jgi:hypothetical protein